MNTKVKSLFSVGLLALFGVMLGAPSAHADTFSFSFTDDLGITPGTVIGTLTFAGTGNFSNASATDITLTSYPGAFASAVYLGAPSIDVPSLPGYTVIANSFTETGGSIVAADLYVTWVDKSGNTVWLQLDSGVTNALFDLTGIYTANLSGLGGVVYTNPLPVATPEPSSISLMLVALAALGTLAAVSKRKSLRTAVVN